MNTFIVWHPDHGQEQEDGRQIMAHDAGDAAERWAARDDPESAEYHIIAGQPATVKVFDGALVTTWIVRGEVSHAYYARAVA